MASRVMRDFVGKRRGPRRRHWNTGLVTCWLLATCAAALWALIGPGWAIVAALLALVCVALWHSLGRKRTAISGTTDAPQAAGRSAAAAETARKPARERPLTPPRGVASFRFNAD